MVRCGRFTPGAAAGILRGRSCAPRARGPVQLWEGAAFESVRNKVGGGLKVPGLAFPPVKQFSDRIGIQEKEGVMSRI